ncbi:MAG: hypothetical protein M3R58_12970 [Pseudomonadota bacterium]|nr:hypothetical protein [Pseudomonadota bacterium]
MKKLLCISAATLVVLTACTSVPMASVSNGASSANWVTDRSQACARADSTPIEMARFTEPAPSGRCETGEYLVKVLPR